jgi:hypothetical protein
MFIALRHGRARSSGAPRALVQLTFCSYGAMNLRHVIMALGQAGSRVQVQIQNLIVRWSNELLVPKSNVTELLEPC